jgi:uncharacterized protein
VKLALLIILVLVVLIGIGFLALAWRASQRAMSPPHSESSWSLAEYPHLVPEEVTVKSKTGVDLAGRLYAGRTRATIVLSHGYGGNQDELLPAADTLHQAGFTVFTYDLRGCGRSEGRVTFGALERDDLSSVVDYLSSRPDVDPERIGALGFSMGAATTVMAAARDARIKAVVDDSGWSHVYHWLKPSLRRTLTHPSDQFSVLSLKLVELRTGVRLSKLRPSRDVGRLSPRPLLIIHGANDDVVPPGDSEELFEAAGEPKELWRVPGAIHGDTLSPGGPTSSHRVVQFFQEALDQPKAGA